jgi:formylmethanofuran dehydrogenase subunit E
MPTDVRSAFSKVCEKRNFFKLENIFDELSDAIEKYDPEFIFLPAYYVAKKIQEKIASGTGRKNAICEVCNELKIEDNNRNRKILRVAERILNSNNP